MIVEMVKITDIVKTDNIIKVSVDDTLSSALSKLSTSHDACFVFKGEEFVGIINPYHHLIKTSLPGNAKVGHCVFHPPRVLLSYSYAKVAQLMDESRVHYLPVFNKVGEFEGIVSARRMLSNLAQSQLFKVKLKDVIAAKKTPLVKIMENDFITTALATFKQTKVSKLLVVDEQNKLKGVLSYYDLISFLITPKQKTHKGERDGDKIHFTHQKVKNFSKKYVLTLNPEETMQDALNLIIEMKIGSVVVLDKERHPIGIVTTKDFLRLLMSYEEQRRIQVITRNLSNQSRHILGGFFNSISSQLKKLQGVKARLFIKEERDGGLFKVVYSIFPKRGKPLVYEQEGRDLKEILKKVKNSHK